MLAHDEDEIRTGLADAMKMKRRGSCAVTKIMIRNEDPRRKARSTTRSQRSTVPRVALGELAVVRVSTKKLFRSILFYASEYSIHKIISVVISVKTLGAFSQFDFSPFKL